MPTCSKPSKYCVETTFSIFRWGSIFQLFFEPFFDLLLAPFWINFWSRTHNTALQRRTRNLPKHRVAWDFSGSAQYSPGSAQYPPGSALKRPPSSNSTLQNGRSRCQNTELLDTPLWNPICHVFENLFVSSLSTLSDLLLVHFLDTFWARIRCCVLRTEFDEQSKSWPTHLYTSHSNNCSHGIQALTIKISRCFR